MALTKVTGQVINTSTDVTVGVLTVTNTLAVGGTVSIGGTLTYEDVTNIDSVGLITARDGISVTSGNVTITGGGSFVGDGSNLTGVASTDNIRTNTNATFLQNVNVVGTGTFGSHVSLGDSDELRFGAGTDLKMYHDGFDSRIHNITGNFLIRNEASSGNIFLRTKTTESAIDCVPDGAVNLYYDGTKKLETASGGVTVTGTVAATSFTGSGAALTGVGASNTSQVIEQILVPCDGTAAPTSRGDMTIQNVTGTQIMTNSYVDVTGSTISYHPPTGTHTVIYSFQCAVANENSVDCIFYAKLIVDGNEVTYARNAYRNRYGQDLFKFDWPIKIGGSANTNTARLANWTAPKTLKIQGRRYDAGNPSRLHITDNWDGSSSEIFVMPVIGVTAIGTPS